MVVSDIVDICVSGNKDGVGQIIEDGDESSLTKQVLNGKTPIEVATCFGRLEVVEELVKNGVSIDFTSQSGNDSFLSYDQKHMQTFLMAAAFDLNLTI